MPGRRGRWTRADRRWYGGGRPVAVEPHKFWPATEAEKRAAGQARLYLRCRECMAGGLLGQDGKYRHAY